ncbi:cohesin domain-containing protein [Candidatus Aminicenantes bacterium AC-334-E05]|nr:cohesin domain-containing protein [Candidatus Aminicenantes bacterium AC-334-E05]
MIINEMRELRGEEVKKPEVKIEVPVKLKTDKEKINLKFIDTNLSSIFKALGKHAGINVLFDEQFKDKPMSFSIEDMTFKEALDSLCLATRNFYRVVNERTIIIVPDNAMKRRQYEITAIKTFYLSNAKAEDVRAVLSQVLRTEYRPPFIYVDKNLNSITLRDSPENIRLAEKLIKNMDKAKGEVIIDLEIMEVSRSKLRQYGIDFDTYGVGLKYETPASGEEKGWINLPELDFSQRSNYFITLPTSFIKLLETDADTKIIAQPRLRGIEGEEITYTVGDKVPIPRTTFTPIAAGGVSQQPITSFEYQDVGITLKITPYIHFEREVTLELEIKVTSLSGTGYAGIPILGTREVKNVIRLKEGETNLLAGLLRDEERKSLKGIAGLKNLPIIGSLFSSTDQTISQTDIILTITPYIIRSISIDKENLEPLWIGLKEEPTRGLPEVEFPEEERRPREIEREKNEISISPSYFTVPKGREFFVNILIRSDEEVGNMSITLNFDPNILQAKDVRPGGFINQFGRNVPFLKNIANGTITIGFSSPDISKGAKGRGVFARISFIAKNRGEGSISITSVSANAPTGKLISFITRDGKVKVE